MKLEHDSKENMKVDLNRHFWKNEENAKAFEF